MGILVALLPQELVNALLPLMLVLAGIALTLRMRRVAGAIVLMVIALIVGPVILDAMMAPILEAIPNALFWPLLVLAAVVLGLVALNGVVQMLFGRGTANRMTALLLADGIKALVKCIVVWPISLAWSLLKRCVVVTGDLITGRGLFKR